MKSQSLFSIILLHYNQPKFVKIALDSIFAQNYSDIELIFADDCSANIDLPDLKDYCQKNKGDNIKNIIWQINPENVGTVKSLNRAVDKASGEFILFFAADDALHDQNTISNFVKAFNSESENVYMISSQCYMMDEKMEENLGAFVKPSVANDFNHLSPIEQFRWLTTDCFLAIGATAMRSSMFKKFGKFNEEYKFVEDWSYFLHLTRSGGKILFCDFDGLLHRDGGVSHNNGNGVRIPKHVIAYRYDLVRILEVEVFPYLKGFSFNQKLAVYAFYRTHKNNYLLTHDNKRTASSSFIVKCFGTSLLRIFLREFMDAADINLRKVKDFMFKALIVWSTLAIVESCINPSLLTKVLSAVNNYVVPAVVGLGVLAILLIWLLKKLLAFKMRLNKHNKK